MTKAVFLIGMPGVGKSTWGKALADACNMLFFDLDEAIETREGRAVAEIFKTEGEAGFREKEARLLAEIIQANQGFIMATGGGTPIAATNFELMKSKGITVYLKTDAKTILRNLDDDTHNRPLLQVDEKLEKIVQDLLDKRSYIYEQADITLDAATLAIEELRAVITSIQ